MSHFHTHTGNECDRGRKLTGRWFGPAAVVAMLWALMSAPASAAPTVTRLAYAAGEIVPIPASIPHEEGDMVDRRIIPNLRWIAERFPIYVSDGFSGKLPSGEHVGCRGCHVRGSDHHNGLAVDISPLTWSPRCDENWRGITRLAQWAEPLQNKPRAPFRWVGYDGDAGHGCGHHLHLSWEHAPAPASEVAEWVEVFAAGFTGVAPQPRPSRKPVEPKRPPTPPGGYATAQGGGLGAD